MALQPRASHTTLAPLHMTPPILWLPAAFLLLSEGLHRSPLGDDGDDDEDDGERKEGLIESLLSPVNDFPRGLSTFLKGL